ncbi:hypothetical protein [uncultured Tateyamaria sp.]|uniref:hypothetical protein n=1 Tax=Tateyamaria sp. 1078 TaxID=3417464 RepID=UPI00262991FD|nr:hypothetical protein [uncultured Tateyamaria sp.]
MRGLWAVLLICPAALWAQDQSAFDAGIAECARYVAAQPEGDYAFQAPVMDRDEDESSIGRTIVYPPGSGGNFDFALSFDYTRGTSTTPGTWACSGTGPASPQWPTFVTTGWIAADAALRSNGLQELNFPGPQKAYANCGAETPDIYVLFNAGAGDRVVFAATTGPAAAAFCTSMGVKG